MRNFERRLAALEADAGIGSTADACPPWARKHRLTWDVLIFAAEHFADMADPSRLDALYEFPTLPRDVAQLVRRISALFGASRRLGYVLASCVDFERREIMEPGHLASIVRDFERRRAFRAKYPTLHARFASNGSRSQLKRERWPDVPAWSLDDEEYAWLSSRFFRWEIATSAEAQRLRRYFAYQSAHDGQPPLYVVDWVAAGEPLPLPIAGRWRNGVLRAEVVQ